MSAALIMEPRQQEEGGDSAHARRAQNILKQKVVSDQLRDQVETDFSEQVFLPEDSSWRVQSVTPDSDVFCYEREISDYKEMMFNKDHKNWVGSDSDDNPVVISVCADTDNMTTQVILRDVRQTKSETFDNHEDCGDVDSVLNLAKIVSPHLEIDNLEEIECEDIKEWIAINDENYNELLLRKNYTIGVLYQRSKQSSESDIFGNIGHCEKFEHFLNQNLGYSSEYDDSAGFVKKAYRDFSLKFYVSTLLPHSTTNSQQLARKARIGNCCVSIVFQAAEDNTIFSPEIITSQFLHVYVVVQPVGDHPDHYKLSVVSKIGVPNFGPVLAPVEIINDENFEKFSRILINAVQASYKTGKLAELRKKYKLAGLSQIAQKIEQWEEAKKNPERDETAGWKCNLL